MPRPRASWLPAEAQWDGLAVGGYGAYTWRDSTNREVCDSEHCPTARCVAERERLLNQGRKAVTATEEREENEEATEATPAFAVGDRIIFTRSRPGSDAPEGVHGTIRHLPGTDRFATEY